jgi:HAD superfamily phosphoserine phosphatase-like hydrolase
MLPKNVAVSAAPKRYLFVSDFDKTLSFNDSGAELAELLGIRDFDARVQALSAQNLVQQGGELAYLLLHDPAFGAVRREHLQEAGRRVRVKEHVALLIKLLAEGLDGHHFAFWVISAAPQEVVQVALQHIVPKEHIIGTQFRYDDAGRIVGVQRVPAGFGKVAALMALQRAHRVGDERIIYAGDGQSDIHVMLHINHRKGYTIAVSQTEQITSIARRTVLSDDATAVLVPVLEDICQWRPGQIRALFEAHELMIWEWAKMRTDVLTVGRPGPRPLDGGP